MKKILMLVIPVVTALSVNAQKIDAAKVPGVVKNSFSKQYPGSTGTWEKEDGKYEVNFTHEGNKMSLLIETNGNIAETETDIKSTDLPADALTYINTHYKGKKISEAAKISKAGIITYEAEVGGVDLIFDANGKFIKKEKQEKDEKNEKD